MKRWTCGLLALVYSLLLAGGTVGAENAAETLETGVVTLIEEGVLLDLDGDGSADEVEYEILKGEDGYDTGYRLRAGAAEITGDGWSMNDKVYALKLNEQSSTLLLISDYGPSDDYETYFYLYEDGTLQPVGTINSLPERMSVENGVITAPVRGQVLYTWFHDADFVLARSSGEEGRTPAAICQIPRYLYPMGLIVTLKVELPLSVSMMNEEISATLEAGSEIVLCASDDREWVYIQTLDGESCGWLRLSSEYGFECLVGEEKLMSWDVFEGLIMAD